MQQDLKYFYNRFYTKIVDEDTLGNAAQVAFYFSFSLFPLLLFLISLFGLVLESADEFRLEMFAYLRRIMPVTAYELVFHTMNEVIEKSSGGKITVGILIALWSSSAGLDALRNALNEVYNVRESRPYWKTKPQSILLTLIIGLLVFTALGIIFYGSQFIIWLLAISHLPIPSPFFLGLLKWVTILVVLLFAFALIYNALPDRKINHWQWITPGSIAAILLWLLASNGFRIYLGYFDSYAKTYGSLGAMIILMLWLYITALVILIGASINQIIEEVYGKWRVVSQAKAIQTGNPEKASEPAKSFWADFIPEKVSSANQKITADSEPAKTTVGRNAETDETAKEKEIEESSEADSSTNHLQKKKLDSKSKSPAGNSSSTKDPDLNKETESTVVSGKNSNKPLVSLTVIGVLGLLMGLMFRHKPDNRNK
jgi:membrane protein